MPKMPQRPRPEMVADVSSITINVESGMLLGGSKAYKPNKHGYYEKVPLLAFGTTTRAQSYYTPESIVEQVTSPQSQFNICLTEGYLYGEWGHPDVDLLTDNNARMARMVRVDERHHCHHFNRVYTGPALDTGGRLLLGDVKPVYPHGDALRTTAEDPSINTAFSLRSITRNTQIGRVSKRDIVKLVTIDCVGAPGIMQASKAFAPIATESFNTPAGKELFVYDMPTDDDGLLVIDSVSLESFSNTELNELVQANKIITSARRTHLVSFRDPSMISTASRKRAFFEDFLKKNQDY